MWTSGLCTWTYILREGRNFKIFLKENYAIMLWIVDTYLLKNAEHGIGHDIHCVKYGNFT